MNVLAIDPGPEKSGWVVFDGERPCEWGWDDNTFLRRQFWNLEIDSLLIEYPKPRGMPTSKEEMDTLFEAGRFVEAWGGSWKPIYRQDVKLALCGNVRAKDANIRQAIIDRYGGDSVAIGGKKCQGCKGRGDVKREGTRGRLSVAAERSPCPDCSNTSDEVGFGSGWETPPGPLNGVSGHVWSALAVALTWKETRDA